MRFSKDATEEAFVAREVIAEQNARTLAAEVLVADGEQFRAAFKKSPIKRAKRAGLQRNAGVALPNPDPEAIQAQARAVTRTGAIDEPLARMRAIPVQQAVEPEAGSRVAAPKKRRKDC